MTWPTTLSGWLDLVARLVPAVLTPFIVWRVVILGKMQQEIIDEQRQMHEVFRPARLKEDLDATIEIVRRRISEEEHESTRLAEAQTAHAETLLVATENRIRELQAELAAIERAGGAIPPLYASASILSDDAWAYLFLAGAENQNPEAVQFMLGFAEVGIPIFPKRFVEDWLDGPGGPRRAAVRSAVNEVLGYRTLSRSATEYAQALVRSLGQ